MELIKHVEKKHLETLGSRFSEKTNVSVCKRKKVGEWKWEGECVKEVNEFRYLDYTVNRYITTNAHVRECDRNDFPNYVKESLDMILGDE